MASLYASDRLDPRSGTLMLSSIHEATPLTAPCAQSPEESPRSAEGNFGDGEKDTVQFSAPIYFVEEVEGELVIDIMRLGSARGSVSVGYFTEDGSAQAGVFYEEVQGTVTMEDGVDNVSVTVKVLERPFWSATLEFKVILCSPVNCVLGNYLHTCRVKVIDKDWFPSSRYRDALASGNLSRVNNFQLFREFFNLIYGAGGVRWQTVLTVVLDQFRNWYLFLTIWLDIYIVDVLFNTNDDREHELLLPSRLHTAYLVGLLYVAPMLVLQTWEMSKAKIDIYGRVTMYLQASMFRKYLNYSEEARQKVEASEMQIAIVSEAAALAEGYTAMLAIFSTIGQIAVRLSVVISHNPAAWRIAAPMPLLSAAWMAWRYHLGNSLPRIGDKEAQLLGYVTECCNKFELIADYFQRPQANETFTRQATELREFRLPGVVFRLRTEFFYRWLGPVFVSAYLAANAQAVFNGTLSLGTFLATLRIFRDLSGEFLSGYEEFYTLIKTFIPLREFTRYMNMQTDLLLWKSVNRSRRTVTQDIRRSFNQRRSATDVTDDVLKHVKGGRRIQGASGCNADNIHIKLVDVGYSFVGAPALLTKVNLHVPQGKLVAIVGPHGAGKTTLLRLLAHRIFPSEGSIFVPSHLRILHVSQDVYLLKQTLLRNLVFGLTTLDTAAFLRVKAVLELMEMRKASSLLEDELETFYCIDADNNGSQAVGDNGKKGLPAGRIKSNPNAQPFLEAWVAASEKPDNGVDPGDASDASPPVSPRSGMSADEPFFQKEQSQSLPWHGKLSAAEKCKLHLARAFIMNPEVMVFQRPLRFNTRTNRLLMRTIKEHVRNRGLAMPPEMVEFRRPRTVFYAADSFEQAMQADVVWKFQEVSKSSYSVCEYTAEDMQADQEELQNHRPSTTAFE